MLWVIMTIAILSAILTIILVGIKGAIELYAPMKAAKEAKKES
jgi:cytochrome c-type biogenesis protein CcmE